MSAIQQMVVATSGGAAPKSVSWNGITYVPLYEGETQTVQLAFANWDSSTVYWSVVEAGSSNPLDSRMVGGQGYGTITPGSGYTGGWSFNFTFSADSTTEGPINYVVRIGSSAGANDYINSSNYALVDSSQAPALVLDLDTVRYTETVNTVENNGTELHIPKAFDSSLDTKISIGYPVEISWGGGLHTTVTGISSGTGSFGPEWIVTVATNVSAGFAGGDTVTFASDSIWPDSSGQNHNAGIFNLSAYSTDNGGVFVFDGTGSYANVPTLTDSTYGSVTVSAWIKPSTVNVTQTIISKEICYKMIITSDGRIAWMVGDAAGNSWTTTIYAAAGLVTAGAWSHVMATVNATATKIYINGVLASTGDGAILIANNYRFAIGAYDTGSSTYGDFFGGRFGEVKVWNYALTEAVVLTQYNTTAARYGLPVIPLSLNFPTSGDNYVSVQNSQSDWALGSAYTIEFWSKSVKTGGIQTVMSQNPSDNGIDIAYQEGKLMFANHKLDAFIEPPIGGVPITLFNIVSQGGWNTGVNWSNLPTTGGTGSGLTVSVAAASGGYVGAISLVNPGKGYTSGDVLTATGESSFSFTIGICTPIGVWTHVAIVRNDSGSPATVYYNGVSQGTFTPGALNDGGNDLVLGRRGSNPFQYFYGKLALIRISNAAKYLTDFEPSLTYGVESDTKLMLRYDPTVDGTTTHPISLQGSVSSSLDFPAYLSLVFNQPDGDYLEVPGNSDWALGTTWTIEFWMKANSSANGSTHMTSGIWGLLNQGGWSTTNSINIALSDSKLVVGQGGQYADVRFTEPTPAQWTHVAIANDAGTQRVFYNGVEQTNVSGTYSTANYANGTDILAIGAMSDNSSHFDGKLALIRISNAAKYTGTFTATTTYGVESDTKLFLSKLNPLVDAQAHIILNTGVTTSTSFPG